MPHQQVRGPIRTALVGFGVAGSVFHAPLITPNTDYRLDVIVRRCPTRSDGAATLPTGTGAAGLAGVA